MTKDIDKVRMSKKVVDADALLETFQYMHDYEPQATLPAGGMAAAQGGLQTSESPAKKSKPTHDASHLTGTHGEPRQEP